MSDGEAGLPRASGIAQRFADLSGGPATYQGTRYQTGVACMEALIAVSRQLAEPLAVLRLRCESRTIVAGGQLGFDFTVSEDVRDRSVEVKGASPSREEVLELVGRLGAAADADRPTVLQLVHGRGGVWAEALDAVVRAAGEAADDDELAALVDASGSAERRAVLGAVPEHDSFGRRSLLGRMVAPELWSPPSVTQAVALHARLLTGDRAVELVLAVDAVLSEAFAARRTLLVSELLEGLQDDGLVRATMPGPSASDAATRAVTVLDACPVPLPEAVLSSALGLPPGGAAAELGPLAAAGRVLVEGDVLWSPGGTARLSSSAAGNALREALTVLVDAPPAQHAEMVAQVPNVVSLAARLVSSDPLLVARAFKTYDKASKATGNLSMVHRLSTLSLEAAVAASQRSTAADEQRWLLGLRGHARICGTAWTLQRVREPVLAAEEMEIARKESEQADDEVNLAFADKCQGRLSRLAAEDLQASGDGDAAARLYDLSRAQLDGAYVRFSRLVADPEHGRLAEEPGECLALRARTALSQGLLGEAEEYAAQAHAELDYLQPQRKAWADVCLVDAEVALAQARDGQAGAREALLAQTGRLRQVLEQFQTAASSPATVGVGASEIVARALRALGILAVENGEPAAAAGLFEEAAAQFDRVDQARDAYRCLAQALELSGQVPVELAAALRAADAGDAALVEAHRLHAAAPRQDAPARHWDGLVAAGIVTAAAKEHRWTDARPA